MSRTTLVLRSKMAFNDSTFQQIWAPLGLESRTDAQAAQDRQTVTNLIRDVYDAQLIPFLATGRPSSDLFRGRGRIFQEAIMPRVAELPNSVTTHVTQMRLIGDMLYDLLRYFRFTDPAWQVPVPGAKAVAKAVTPASANAPAVAPTPVLAPAPAPPAGPQAAIIIPRAGSATLVVPIEDPEVPLYAHRSKAAARRAGTALANLNTEASTSPLPLYSSQSDDGDTTMADAPGETDSEADAPWEWDSEADAPGETDSEESEPVTTGGKRRRAAADSADNDEPASKRQHAWGPSYE